jgi:hypothetical protein
MVVSNVQARGDVTGRREREGRARRTSYVPGRTSASFPRYRQMSDVITSRSMPSRGTKYSFWRAEAGGGACWLDLLLGLPAIV